jgi:hypothetical protein
MELNIGGAGSGKPYGKFSSATDEWLVRGGDGELRKIERPTFVADLSNIRTGWMEFRKGEPPKRVMDPNLKEKPPSPGDGFARGFVFMVHSPRFFGGTVEFSSTSIHTSNAINELYAQYLAERSGHPGQLPVVACVGSKPMKGGRGVNYRPIFEIVRWVDRPAELPDVSPVSEAEVYKGKGDGGPTGGSGNPPPPPEPRRPPDPPKDPIF